MVSRIRFELSVPAEVREDEARFVSFCPALDVYSQGPSEEAALHNLAEAVQLFVESCLARGTLDRVLKDCGRNNMRTAGMSRERYFELLGDL